MLKRTLSALALAALATGAAHAQLTYSLGTDTPVINNYDPTGTTTVQTSGKVDAVINTGLGGTLTATFLGFEALDSDTFGFDFGAGLLTNQTSTADVSSIAGPVGAGDLTFSFVDLTTGESVGNGGNTSVYSSYAVFGSFAGSVFTPYTKGGLYDLVIGFNDGLKVDADYDDLVVGLKLTPAIPEPETYALMLAGLGAVAFMSRRRKQQA